MLEASKWTLKVPKVIKANVLGTLEVEAVVLGGPWFPDSIGSYFAASASHLQLPSLENAVGRKHENPQIRALSDRYYKCKGPYYNNKQGLHRIPQKTGVYSWLAN